MSKVEKVICIKDCFMMESEEKVASVGIIYDLDNGSIIDDSGYIHTILDHGEKDDFFNEYFRDVKEDDPIEILNPSHPNCTKESWDNAKKEHQQQSEHYQKEEDEDLETIEKMQIISDIFEEQGRTFTAMEGYTLLNQYKYLDRMGKKDEPKKEGYKICDYYERNKNEKWLHEVDK